jgi:hypothetical protein
MHTIFGITALVYGAGLLVCAFAYSPGAVSENTVGWSFLIVGVFFAPFVHSFTALGLNSAESGLTSRETHARNASLERECRTWRYLVYGGYSLPVVAVVGTGLGLVAHPVLVIGGYACIVSGFWFLMVNQVARQTLGRQRQEN